MELTNLKISQLFEHLNLQLIYKFFLITDKFNFYVTIVVRANLVGLFF